MISNCIQKGFARISTEGSVRRGRRDFVRTALTGCSSDSNIFFGQLSVGIESIMWQKLESKIAVSAELSIKFSQDFWVLTSRIGQRHLSYLPK